jgi:hypothetical protein
MDEIRCCIGVDKHAADSYSDVLFGIYTHWFDNEIIWFCSVRVKDRKRQEVILGKE